MKGREGGGEGGKGKGREGEGALLLYKVRKPLKYILLSAIKVKYYTPNEMKFIFRIDCELFFLFCPCLSSGLAVC